MDWRVLQWRITEAKRQIAQIKGTCFKRHSMPSLTEQGGMGDGQESTGQGVCMSCQASCPDKFIPSTGSSLKFIPTHCAWTIVICSSENRKHWFHHSGGAIPRGSSNLTSKQRALCIRAQHLLGIQEMPTSKWMYEWMHAWIHEHNRLFPHPKWSHSMIWALYLSFPRLVSSVYWWFSASQPQKQKIQLFPQTQPFFSGPTSQEDSRKAWSTKVPLGKRARGAFNRATPACFVHHICLISPGSPEG